MSKRIFGSQITRRISASDVLMYGKQFVQDSVDAGLRTRVRGEFPGCAGCTDLKFEERYSINADAHDGEHSPCRGRVVQQPGV